MADRPICEVCGKPEVGRTEPIMQSDDDGLCWDQRFIGGHAHGAVMAALRAVRADRDRLRALLAAYGRAVMCGSGTRPTSPRSLRGSGGGSRQASGGSRRSPTVDRSTWCPTHGSTSARGARCNLRRTRCDSRDRCSSSSTVPQRCSRRVHPAYAMSWGGRLDRDRIRVATLGGRRGDGWGRATWEWDYYGWRLDQIGYRQADTRPR